jgi:hypothetical protein
MTESHLARSRWAVAVIELGTQLTRSRAVKCNYLTLCSFPLAIHLTFMSRARLKVKIIEHASDICKAHFRNDKFLPTTFSTLIPTGENFLSL